MGICLGYAIVEGALKLMVLALFCNGGNGNSPMGIGLRPVVDGILGQHLHHRIDVFVVDHSEDDAQLSATLLCNLWSKILPSAHVVACVADNQGPFLHLLPTTHKAGQLADMGETICDGGR